MDELPLAHILTKARAVLTDEVGVAAAVSAMTVGAGASVKRADATSEMLCFQCNQPNHLALQRLSASSEESRRFLWRAWTWQGQVLWV